MPKRLFRVEFNIKTGESQYIFLSTWFQQKENSQNTIPQNWESPSDLDFSRVLWYNCFVNWNLLWFKSKKLEKHIANKTLLSWKGGTALAENVKEIIAANLVSLRKGSRLTQQQLAERLNYSDKLIYKIMYENAFEFFKSNIWWRDLWNFKVQEIWIK